MRTYNAGKTKSYPDEGESSTIRKVHSFEIRRRRSLPSALTSRGTSRTESWQVASRFSSSNVLERETSMSPNNLIQKSQSPSCCSRSRNTTIDEHEPENATSRSIVPHRPTGDISDTSTPATFVLSPLMVGYVSLTMLIFVTISRASPEWNMAYFQVESSKSTSSSPRLGAAAISSLTEALSPILPFAGGADLRRGEYSLLELLPSGTFDSWEGFYAHNTWGDMSDTSQESSASVSNTSRVGQAPEMMSIRERLRIRRQIDTHPNIISAPDSFLALSDIAELTLAEISEVLENVLESNSQEYDPVLFKQGWSERVLNAVRSVDNIVSKTRGEGVESSLRQRQEEGEAVQFGDIDALQFCAAMRIYAEWRVLRLVPPGFKAYAAGMGLGHKDVVQNLAKVETAVFAWIAERKQIVSIQNQYRENMKETCAGNHTESTDDLTSSDICNSDVDLTPLIVRSPTLREILQAEVDLDIHGGKLPKLKEKSAAMGLLWVRRQLQYQSCIFANILSMSFPSANLAVASAYNEVYDKYHGWAVQKIFTYSFQAAPEVSEIFKIMDSRFLENVLKRAKVTLVEGEEVASDAAQASDKLIQDETVSVSTEENLTSYSISEEQISKQNENPLERLGNHIGSEWDKFGHHIHAEWDKFGHHVQGEWEKVAKTTLKLLNKYDDASESSDDDKTFGLSGEALETFVTEEMSKEIVRQMAIHLEITKPLLNDLSALFEDMDMNDPTKV